MAINNTPKEMPTGGCNPTAGDTINDLDFPTRQRPGKAFATLQAAFAMKGYTLHRSDASDGPEIYCAERWGLVRYLPTLHDVVLFLVQRGGRL